MSSAAIVDFSIVCRLLQQGCRELVCDAASNSIETGAARFAMKLRTMLLVSAISVWELGVLQARGRIELSAPWRD
jgi:PIN domain nuclease of toxin-antitoxin system